MKLKVALSAVLAGLAAAGWLLAAPAQLGGRTTYVTTHGDSMEPALFSGDLAIIRSARSYAVGDVTAYHSPELKTVVMHRIVSVDDGRYTLQGDNNDFLDPDQPTRDDLIGTLRLRVPQGGLWLRRATSPSVVAAISFLLLASGGATAAATRRQRRKKRNAVKPTSLPPSLRQLPPAARSAAAAIAALAVASVALGLVSWTRPLTSADRTNTETTSTVTFSYAATVPQSAAYDGTTVTQPQPVFRKLADEVDVAFDYENDVPVSDATVRVTAELSTANGWQSTVPLAPPERFTGPSYTGRVKLKLSELHARADAAANAIGDEPAGDVSVTIVPVVTTGGDAEFRAELPLTLSPSALRVAGDETALTVSQSDAGLPTVGERPATLALVGQSIPVRTARTAGAGGLVVAGAAALVLAAIVRRARKAPEPLAIQARYAQVLLPVDPLVLPTGRPVVEVPEVGALVRLAERYGLFVMHWHRGGVHTYVVLDDSATYRYRSGVSSWASRSLTEEPAGVPS